MQTSNNLAQVTLEDGQYRIHCLTRSFTEDGKLEQAHEVQTALSPLGAKINLEGTAPGW